MTSLVSLESVQTRLKLGDSIPSGVESLLLQLMDFATFQIAEYLRVGDFDEFTDRVDEFYVDSHASKPFRRGYPDLLLSRGFLSGITSLTMGESYQSIADATISSTDYKLDADKGLILIMGEDFVGVSASRLVGTNYDNVFLRATYSGGFASSGGVYSGVPSWLQLIALAVISDVYTSTNGCEDGNCNDACKASVEKYASMLDTYIRYAPSAYNPL